MPRRSKASKSRAVTGPHRLPNGQLVGGNPGNRGGGRTPSAIRADARGRFDELLPVLTKIAKRKNTANRDRIRAADVLGKYGMDKSVSYADIRECLREQQKEIFALLPEEQAQQLLDRLRPIWIRL